LAGGLREFSIKVEEKRGKEVGPPNAKKKKFLTGKPGIRRGDNFKGSFEERDRRSPSKRSKLGKIRERGQNLRVRFLPEVRAWTDQIGKPGRLKRRPGESRNGGGGYRTGARTFWKGIEHLERDKKMMVG